MSLAYLNFKPRTQPLLGMFPGKPRGTAVRVRTRWGHLAEKLSEARLDRAQSHLPGSHACMQAIECMSQSSAGLTVPEA